MEKTIIYSDKQIKVACDEKCEKAWGIAARPKEKLSEDDDDVVFLSDSELGTAPVDQVLMKADKQSRLKNKIYQINGV